MSQKWLEARWSEDRRKILCGIDGCGEVLAHVIVEEGLRCCLLWSGKTSGETLLEMNGETAIETGDGAGGDPVAIDETPYREVFLLLRKGFELLPDGSYGLGDHIEDTTLKRR